MTNHKQNQEDLKDFQWQKVKAANGVMKGDYNRQQFDLEPNSEFSLGMRLGIGGKYLPPSHHKKTPTMMWKILKVLQVLEIFKVFLTAFGQGLRGVIVILSRAFRAYGTNSMS
ncbi:hypothetical protein [Cylindrospermopsis curvispora]|uniref:Uncharacterized protein n=1 Tax=Cylindrospermopsis curvispora GIHE-G1 TaxID=2666332 RepID=A0A7H0EW91_9CYAN|nr:hypothetical protein [Cylindrospermopsis curvispora]QNP28057.1 hypothetical protein IAR63_08765 [Cylindrospermopsis curvispora GIHE-G1]